MKEYLVNTLSKIVNKEFAVTLSLSKGGWEGWLQCELWYIMSIYDKKEVEREVAYPSPQNKKRCDLVIKSDKDIWIELKAFGIFRKSSVPDFVKKVEKDVKKIKDYRPANTQGFAFVVVPNTIATDFEEGLKESDLDGFTSSPREYSTLFYKMYGQD